MAPTQFGTPSDFHIEFPPQNEPEEFVQDEDMDEGVTEELNEEDCSDNMDRRMAQMQMDLDHLRQRYQDIQVNMVTTMVNMGRVVSDPAIKTIAFQLGNDFSGGVSGSQQRRGHDVDLENEWSQVAEQMDQNQIQNVASFKY